MNILIINQYASNANYPSGAGERHYFLAKEYPNDYYISIVTSTSNHLLTRKPHKRNKERIFREILTPRIDFCWLFGRKVNLESGLSRFVSWIEFAYGLFFLKLKNKPDVVVLSSMSIVPVYYCIYVKLRYKSKLIVEIRDIWPLTLKEIGGVSTWHPVYQFLKLSERLSYFFADHIVSVLPNFSEYFKLKFKINRPITWIPNGVVMNDYISSAPTESSTNRILMYTGTIGKANNMKIFIEALIKIKLKVLDRLQVVVIGEGPEKASLKRLAISEGLSFVEFRDKMPKIQMHKVLSNASFCYHGCKKLPLYEYGISPNKLNDYMLAKKPIISASGLKADPVNFANCGIVTEPDVNALSEAILQFTITDESYLKELGENGYSYLKSTTTYPILGKKYVSIFRSLVESRELN